MDKDIVLSVFHAVSSRLGYNHPKPGQVEAVTTFVLGRDVFISLPTGYGKSYVNLACLWFLTLLCERFPSL